MPNEATNVRPLNIAATSEHATMPVSGEHDAKKRKISEIGDAPHIQPSQVTAVSCEMHLHNAAMTKASFDVVRLLLASNPGAASEKDNKGRLPLHYAVGKDAPPDVVRALLASYSRAAAEKDSAGRLPLHYAVGKDARPSVIQALLAAHPTAVTEKDNRGNTPMHYAIKEKAPSTVVAMLLGRPAVESPLLTKFGVDAGSTRRWTMSELYKAWTSTNPGKSYVTPKTPHSGFTKFGAEFHRVFKHTGAYPWKTGKARGWWGIEIKA